MAKISNLKVNQVINKFIDENPQFSLDSDKVKDIKDLFDKLMNESSNITKNEWEQEALITDIAIGCAYNEPADLIFREHSDNKHMSFFDNFLEKGEADRISRILSEYGLPTEVLRGVKPNIDINFERSFGNDTVEIKGRINPSPDSESEQDDFFEIWLNGKKIYEWNRNEFDEVEEVGDFKTDDIYEPDSDYEPNEERRAKLYTKSGKLRKGVYIATIEKSNGEVITKELTSKGQIVYRDSKGRFTRK
jgi:hypothetical protein